MKNYHFAVFIGRFQPYHNGHHHIISQGLQRSEKIIILCGSAHLPVSHRNPWSFQERKTMILNSFSKDEAERITVLPLMDSPYNDAIWSQSVQTIVNGVVQALNTMPHNTPRIALIGHSKDHSSFYLKMFPQWESIEIDNLNDLNATNLRDDYFSHAEHFAHSDSIFNGLTPKGTQAFFAEQFSQTAFDTIRAEHEFIEDYKKQWQAAPYPPVFVTVDAVVIQSGHILLVKRRARPGKGLAALAGGFIRQHERLQDACIRELREETKLKIPEPVLRGCIKRQHTFDDPHRSSRGRTITHAFLIELPVSENLPKVKGGDDAEKAFWLPLADMNPEKMFEDHYFIVRHLLGE
ncbi:MAG: bifunctional nicotinamide-nucleotide adenylyltransferase/Nudix hydroxylase [Methylococcales bacterium]|nr:bifunctional nicotinamide-nucleotide adenylyltransferase/Nudix hydroxylase [Methylococcales bacterium]